MIHLHRDFLHLQRRAKRDLYGLILGRVIDRDTCANGHETRRALYSRNRFNTILRLHLFGFGLLYLHARELRATGHDLATLRKAGL